MATKKNFVKKFLKLYFIIILCFYLLITPVKNECNRSFPILLEDGTCGLEYCSASDYENEKCIVSNEIIKTQWLTNIIRIGDKDFRYVNFATYSNGSMIIETTAYPGNKYRYFFGLQSNGLPYFKNSNHFSIEISNQQDNSEKSRFEAEIFVVKLDESPYLDQEYLVSIPQGNKYCELYNLDIGNVVNQKKATEILTKEMINFRGSISKITLDGKNYYLFAYTTSEGFVLRRFLFKKPEFSFGEQEKKSVSRAGTIKGQVSCFVIEQSKYSICAYIASKSYSSMNPVYYFCQLAIDKDLNIKNFTMYSGSSTYNPYNTYNTYNAYTVYSDEKSFVKGIHLKDDIGVYIFYAMNYYYYQNYNNKITHPILLFKRFNEDRTKFEDLFKTIPYIELNKYTNVYLYSNNVTTSRWGNTYTNRQGSSNWGSNRFGYSNWGNNNLNSYNMDDHIFFNTYCLKNDFIKISENKLCFITTSSKNETLYIVLINIVEDENVVISYYSINIFKLYNFKILLDMAAHLYNNFIAFAFSYCNSSTCYTDTVGAHYSAFLLFSYPNRTDLTYNINRHLFINNDIKINNITMYLKSKAKIENNIFGYNYNGFNIKENNCDRLNLVSLKRNQNINLNERIEEEKLLLEFKTNSYTAMNCSIKYTYIYTETSFEEFYNYLDIFDDSYGYLNKTSYNSQRDYYEGKIIKYRIIIEENLITNCGHNCELCLERDPNYCITCQNNFNYVLDDSQNEKKLCEESYPDTTIIEIEKTTEQPSEQPTEQPTELQTEQPTETKTEKTEPYLEETETNIETEKITDKATEYSNKTCTNEQILKGNCSGGSMSNYQVGEIFNTFKETVLTKDYKGENTIIETENVILQISTLNDQKNSLNPNFSSIDLGECENILKAKHNISERDSLIVLKTDIKSPDLSSTYVQYEIYNPYTLEQLNMDYCKDIKIGVNVPVNLDSDTLSLYDSLSESGYNLFDSEDAFYNDICSTFTSANGTDMTLEDRKKEMFSSNANISICQEACKFESYDKKTRKARCDCDVQSESTQTDMTKINFDKGSMGTTFLSTLTNSNFMVLKCYKLVLDFKNLLKNKGRVIMSIILISFISLMIIYFFKDRKSVKKFIETILKSKMSSIKNKNKNIEHKLNKKGKTNKANKKRDHQNGKMKKGKIRKLKKNEPPKKNFINKNRKKNCSNTTENHLMSKISKSNPNIGLNINIIPIKNINYGKMKNKNNLKQTPNKMKMGLDQKDDVKIYKSKFLKTDKDIMSSEKNLDKGRYFINTKEINDEELNTLEYEIAIVYDKRTYFQYYWSLLKKKQLILFTFMPANDYNLFTIKISLFFIAFSLYFTINGFFFSDETMHKIHEAKGSFSIFNQIPQILYSTVICSAINMILKLLSLSEKNILLIKHEKSMKIAVKKSKNIEKCINIKFIIFFILSCILLLFFWYFISCFCAVYNNTQFILIKDTLVSFALSMLYPFGLNLLPGMLRIPAIRAKNKDKKCIYKISGIIAMI